jgi:hypothetical protein
MIDVYDLFLQISGGDQNLCNELITITKCLANNKNYKEKPIINIYGRSLNNKLLFLSIIELLYNEDEYKFLNEITLYNNYALWYKKTLKLCFINDFHPSYFNMIQNNVINLAQNNIFVGYDYKSGTVCKPLLKFIIMSNYKPNVFSERFSDLCTHINFDMDSVMNGQFDMLYNQIKNNKSAILEFIYDIIL